MKVTKVKGFIDSTFKITFPSQSVDPIYCEIQTGYIFSVLISTGAVFCFIILTAHNAGVFNTQSDIVSNSRFCICKPSA